MNYRQRVAIVMPEIFHGGAETQFRTLIDNIDSDRIALTVFIEQSYERPDRSSDNHWTEERKGRVHFVKLNGLSSHRGLVRRLCSALRLGLYVLPHLWHRNFDLVLVYSALGLRITPLCRLHRLPTVFSERNDAVYSRLELLRKRSYFSAANAVVCNSANAAQNFRRYGYSPEIIENGVQVSNLPARTRVPPAHGLKIVVPGRIARVKNQRLIIEALPALEGYVACVYLAGAVEEPDYLVELEELIASLGLGPRVKMLGFVHDMDSLYETSDLLVLPSRAEGTPNVLLEAIVREVPCLASDIPSNRSVLRNDDFLFDMNDPGTLIAAIQRFAQMAEAERHNVAQQHRCYVIERFSVRAMVQSYEHLFARIGRAES